MPSPFPRVSIVVSQVQHHVLARLAELEGRSQASYVRRVLDAATPALVRILEAQEAYRAADAALAQDVLRETLDELDRDEEFMEQLTFLDMYGPPANDDVADGDRETPGAERGRTPTPAATASRPPYCNTGVRDPEPGGATNQSGGPRDTPSV